MTTCMRFLAVALAMGMAMTAPAQTADSRPAEPGGKLKVGDPAPALTPGKWLKGEPIKAFEKGTIYVVEFWATWCPPCRESIPHLTKLQAQFKDKGIVIIGLNCSEQDPEKVAPFVRKMGAKMEYRVALDDTSRNKDGAMSAAWMAASGQEGIPAAFVVDKEGKIAWIGHPMELDKVLEAIVAGTFDAAKIAAEAQQKREAELVLQEIMAKIEMALEMGRTKQAFTAVEELAKSHPDLANTLQILKYRILVKRGNEKAAAELGEKLAATFKDDAGLLGEFVAAIMGEQEMTRNLSLAERLALRCVELTPEENFDPLDSLADVYSAAGKLDQALAAVAKMEKAASDEYQKNQVLFTRMVVLLKKKEFAAATEARDRYLAAVQGNVELLLDRVSSLLDQKDPSRELMDTAEKLSDAAMKTDNKDLQQIAELYKIRILLKKGDAAGVKAITDSIVASASTQPERIMVAITELIKEGEAKHADPQELELAERIATEANGRTDGKNSLILSTLADVHCARAKAELRKAVEFQTQAVKNATDNDLKTGLQCILDDLRKKAERFDEADEDSAAPPEVPAPTTVPATDPSM